MKKRDLIPNNQLTRVSIGSTLDRHFTIELYYKYLSFIVHGAVYQYICVCEKI